MYRAQRVDEKNDAICLVMFASKVMAIRMSKMYFLFNTEKNRPSLGTCVRYLSLIWLFYKILWIMEFCRTISTLSTFKNTGFH